MLAQLRHYYKFGQFQLDARELTLWRGDDEISLTPKAVELLLILVQNSGRAVGRTELIKALWPNTFVGEANLTQNVFILRKTLGDSPKSHEYIQTVATRGYRFVAEVTEVGFESEVVGREAFSAASVFQQDLTTQGHWPISLAVLPFANLTSNPQAEYLSDGLTENIINNLSQVSQLKVTSRNTVFRFKGIDKDLQGVGRELAVSAILVGKVLEVDPTSVIVRTELFDAVTGWQLWGEQYEKHSSRLMELQEEIAKEITEKLQIKLSKAERKLLSKKYTGNAKAYHAYLKGRFFWNKYTRSGIEKGIGYFQQAIQEDPNYALAYTGLADAYQRLSNVYLPPHWALPKTMAAAMKAVEIDDLLPEAHSSLGLIKLYYNHDWAGAEAEYKKAIELNDGVSLVYKRLGECLILTKRFEEGLDNYERALDLDPLSLQIGLALGNCLHVMGRYDEAITQLQKVIDLDETYCPARLALGLTLRCKGNFAESLKELKRAWQLDQEAYVVLGFLGHAYGVSGNRQAALKVLKQLESTRKKKYVTPYGIAITHLGLGNKEATFEWLEKTFEENNDFLVWLNVGPELDSLRSDPRFVDLLQRVGFPQ